MMKQTIKEKLIELFKDGKKDSEIAKALGYKTSTITAYRSTLGLSNYNTSEEKNREKKIEETGLETISQPKEQAQKEWEEYRELLKSRKGKVETHLIEITMALSHMRRGRKVIDIYEVIKHAGLNEKGEPKLAIARADCPRIIFEKENDGRGNFVDTNYHSKFNVRLPENTFPRWETNEKNDWIIKEPKEIRTKVPIVPAQFMPKGKLNNYYLLWEVENWEVIPKDPILLKRITNNLFVVLAVWDLTPLELAILRGR